MIARAIGILKCSPTLNLRVLYKRIQAPARRVERIITVHAAMDRGVPPDRSFLNWNASHLSHKPNRDSHVGPRFMTSIHLPVLLAPILNTWLAPLIGKAERGSVTIVDGTFGGGGHALQIARRLRDGDTLVGIDRDPLPIRRFIESAAASTDQNPAPPRPSDSSPRDEHWIEWSGILPSGCRLVLANASYCALPEILEELGQSRVHGILLDLGLSSDQLEDADRGFSFRLDAPLDLRFNPTLGISASQWLLKHSEEEIANAIYLYGEERFSRRIARAIVERNRTAPIATSKELADLIHRAVPGKIHGRVDSATRTFQALRIAVNRELEHVERAMNELPELLAEGDRNEHPGGTPAGELAVISFHSLEDRIVKHAMREDPRLEVLTKKPLVATESEIGENPRSRSAKLRIARRISIAAPKNGF